jgi:hypothetical protein
LGHGGSSTRQIVLDHVISSQLVCLNSIFRVVSSTVVPCLTFLSLQLKLPRSLTLALSPQWSRAQLQKRETSTTRSPTALSLALTLSQNGHALDCENKTFTFPHCDYPLTVEVIRIPPTRAPTGHDTVALTTRAASSSPASLVILLLPTHTPALELASAAAA